MNISPNFQHTKLQENPNFRDYVDVIEDRLNGWLLDWADHLNGDDYPDAGFAVLTLGIGYFETFQIFHRGQDSERRSKKFFKETFISVFESEFDGVGEERKEEVAEKFYLHARCGLYHQGMVRGGVGLADDEDRKKAIRFTVHPISLDVHEIAVCRHTFVRRIQEHFSDYIDQLRDADEDQEIAENFMEGWKIVHSLT